MRTHLLRTTLVTLLAATGASMSACTPQPSAPTPGRLTYEVRSGAETVDSGGGSAAFRCTPPSLDPTNPFAHIIDCRMTTGPDFSEPDGTWRVTLRQTAGLVGGLGRSTDLRVVTPDGTAFDFDDVLDNSVDAPCLGAPTGGTAFSGYAYPDGDAADWVRVDVTICDPSLHEAEGF
jgi:hypothetical protein